MAARRYCADLLSRSFRGLQGDVAGISVGHDDVDDTLADIVSLDEAVIANGKRCLFQYRGGFSDLVEPLDLLDPDIEQPDGGRFEAEQRARHGRAHQCELDELTGVGPHIGADIEHDALGLDRRPDRGNRRAIDAFERLQAELGHGHERAGIARRHGGVGAPVLHRLKRKPHARPPAALAKSLARLCVHGHGDVGVDDLRLRRESRMVGKHGLDAGRVADEQKAHVGMPHERDGSGRNDDAGTVVPAHGVERYGDWSTHSLCRSGKILPLARSAAATPGNETRID